MNNTFIDHFAKKKQNYLDSTDQKDPIVDTIATQFKYLYFKQQRNA